MYEVQPANETARQQWEHEMGYHSAERAAHDDAAELEWLVSLGWCPFSGVLPSEFLDAHNMAEV
jgi:hypothetical protein